MAVTLIGANGLFTRIGKVLDLAEDGETHQTTLATGVTDIQAAYSDADLDMLLSIKERELSIQKSSVTTTFQQVRAIVEKTIIDMVNDDNKQPDRTLPTALTELSRQMRTAVTHYLTPNGVSIDPAVAGGSNVGNGLVLRRFDQVFVLADKGVLTEDNQYLRAEDIVLACTADAQVSGSEGRETFSIKGELRIDDIADPAWPDGQGISGSIQVSDPAVDQRTGVGQNVLRNTDFEDWTGNTPDGWTIAVGAATTNVLKGTTKRRGSFSLEIIGDAGLTLTKLEQTFSAQGVTGQTAGKLIPATRYMMVICAAKDAGVLAGVVRFSIKDSANTILWSSNVSISSFNTSFIAADETTKNFTTGLDVKAGTLFPLKFVIELTTALTNGESIYIDDLLLIPMTQHGAHGPMLNIYPGIVPFKKGDYFSITALNDRASKWAKFLDKYLDLNSLAGQLPSTGTTLVNDTLIG